MTVIGPIHSPFSPLTCITTYQCVLYAEECIEIRGAARAAGAIMRPRRLHTDGERTR